ncbi:PREDICTED: beta-defensin 126 [Ceratotherium simum simum]|uniref:Beta-defensin 126 n=1 Tax=Ceratotherium simum simum TaxID=73337 RepID=A0ABM0I8F0_CERSS|nr:PREDICTED: beta-defensin 126 [Ceratotherium simum simum]
MKSLLFTLTIVLLLAQFISGNWFLRKCENKTGYCKKKCRIGELQKYSKGKCAIRKVCCVMDINHDIKPLTFSNTASMPTVKNQQLSTTKKLKTTVMVITTSTV